MRGCCEFDIIFILIITKATKKYYELNMYNIRFFIGHEGLLAGHGINIGYWYILLAVTKPWVEIYNIMPCFIEMSFFSAVTNTYQPLAAVKHEAY